MAQNLYPKYFESKVTQSNCLPARYQKGFLTELTSISLLAETHVHLTKLGKNLITTPPLNATKVQAGDVIGWVGDISAGALAFEQTANDPSFFYSGANFNLSVESLLDASGGVTRHDVKHVLRAHVSQPSQAAVYVNFVGAGIHKVTANVENVAVNVLQTCEVSVQVPS